MRRLSQSLLDPSMIPAEASERCFADRLASLDGLVDLYVHIMTAGGSTGADGRFSLLKRFNHGDVDLLNRHKEGGSLILDKYLPCALPCDDTVSILESTGFMDVAAMLHPSSPYVLYGERDGNTFIMPSIVGDRHNPYVRFTYAKSSGSRACGKLQQLAVPLPGAYLGDGCGVSPVVDLLTLTFPAEVSNLLLHPGIRDSILKRADKCFSRFFKALFKEFGVVPGDHLGCSASRHEWDSRFPLLPHLHYHAVMPHFSYHVISHEFRVDTLERFVCLPLYEGDGDRELGLRELFTVNRCMDHSLPAPEAPYLFNFKYCRDDVIFKSMSEAQLDVFGEICDRLRERLVGRLGFAALRWMGSATNSKGKEVSVPVDSTKLRFLWSSIVSQEFKEYLWVFGDDDVVMCDIFVEYCRLSNKTKLLHFLTYKSRPAVLDVDLLLRSLPTAVVNHDGVTPDSVSLDVAALRRYLYCMRESSLLDESQYLRYDGYITRFEELLKHFFPEDFVAWLQHLVTVESVTRVFGFWKCLSRYGVLPTDPPLELPVPHICPVCGDVYEPICGLKAPVFSHVIVRCGSRFLLYDGDPPESGGGG